MNRKKFIICESLTIIIFLIITITISNIQYNNYKRISNESISSLIGEIKKSYPNITDEEIIDTLNNTDDVETTMLEKYGYKDADEYSKKMANSYKLSLTESIVIPVVFILILISIYLYYRNTEEKRIKDINSYLSDINNKKYHLLIQDNNEDELSKLHNELYKTTVMLKETSEIDRLEKQKLSTALADISHQLKTPLTSIRILLDNINENPNMDDKTKNEFLSDISKQVDWMSSLIISLLKIARLDANAVSMCDKEINIKDLLDEVKENLSILLDIKNIELDIKYEGNPKINLDYQWNKEAITNIVKNAIEHSNEDSKITIDVVGSNLYLKIDIIDYGESISKEDKKHIFERFYKSKNSSKNSIGIGLSLSKSIIEKENGYITVDSKENDYTKFTIKYIK